MSPGDAVALARAISNVMGRGWDRDRIANGAATPDWHEVAQMYSKVIDEMIAEKT